MFTLRKITGDGIEINIALGKSYTLISKERNLKEFTELSIREGHDEINHRCFGFISNENGVVNGIYSNQQNYIMTESGKTFDNLNK